MNQKIVLCMGSSCYTRGNNITLNTIQDFLFENKLEDLVSFRGELCSCNCKSGPNMKIGDKTYQGVDASTVLKILTEHFADKVVK